MKIYLASRSLRRRELLAQIGVEYELVDVEINEDWDGTEKPEDYVCRIAREKAEAGSASVNNDMPLLAADTAVVLDGDILGKAETPAMAAAMLQRLSGKSHRVLSAVTVITNKPRTMMNESIVSFRSLKPAEIEDYVASGEPIGKAGGYASAREDRNRMNTEGAHWVFSIHPEAAARDQHRERIAPVSATAVPRRFPLNFWRAAKLTAAPDNGAVEQAPF